MDQTRDLDVEESADCLERAKLGDVDAFVRLVGSYERGLFSIILKITKHREDAEDVMQEALLRAYTHINTFRGESRFSTWLTRIGINQALMCLRGRRKANFSLDSSSAAEEDFITLDLPDSRPNPEQHCGYSEFEAALHGLVEALPSSCRTVVLMRYLQERSIEETAKSLGISVAATKSRLLRARRHLRKQLMSAGRI